MVSVSGRVDEEGCIISYKYNDWLQIMSVVMADAGKVLFAYDGGGRLARIMDPEGGILPEMGHLQTGGFFVQIELEYEIMEAVRELNIEDKVTAVAGEEKNRMLSKFQTVFVAGSPRVWWLSLRYKPDIFAFEGEGALGYRRIADFFDREEEVWFVAEDEFNWNEQLLYKAKIKYIIDIIGECSCFEYNIISKNGDRFLCETDHDLFLYIDINKNQLKEQ